MLKSDEEIAKSKETTEKGRTPRGKGFQETREISKVLDQLAKEKGTSITTVAAAWVMQKV